MAKGESLYTFPKLMGSGNYKKWSRDMAFALQEAELWSYVTGARKMPRERFPFHLINLVRKRETLRRKHQKQKNNSTKETKGTLND